MQRRWEDGVSPKGRAWKSLRGALHKIRGLWAGPDIPRFWNTMEGLLRTIQQFGPTILGPDL
eukprot:2766744-Pyramimonas_sp.AAC.1